MGTGLGFEDCVYIDNQGRDIFGIQKKDFWKYDPDLDEWKEIRSLPDEEGRWNAVAFVIENRAFVGLGQHPHFLFPDGDRQDFYEYHPEHDRWTKKQDFPIPLSQAVSFTIPEEGKAYVGTGRYCHGDCDCFVLQCYLGGFYEFDPNDERNGFDEFGKPNGNWVAKAALPERDERDIRRYPLARKNAVSFSLNGLGYVSTGLGVSNFRTDVWRFDPLDDTEGKDDNGNPLGTWTQMEDIPITGIEWGIGFSIGDLGYLGLGGQFNLPTVSSFWRYDPVSDSWLALADIGIPRETLRRQAAVSFILGGTAYVGTGDVLIAENENVADNQFYKYIPNLTQ